MQKPLILISLILFVGCNPVIDQPPEVQPVAESPPAAIAPTVEPAAPVAADSVFGQKVESVWTGKCVSITDGDSLTVLNAANEQIKIRLASIDCPEPKQPFSTVAKDRVGTLCHEKTVEIHQTGKDRYGRVLAFVLVDGVNVNEQLIRDGLAWHYKQYSKDTELQALEDSARESKQGLWVDAEPVPPWEFRKRK